MKKVLFAVAGGLAAAMVSVPAFAIDDRIIVMSQTFVVSSMKLTTPQLKKAADQPRGEVVVETYASAPSQARLILETLPAEEWVNGVAVIKATLDRPLADKPSPYDSGLGKTLDAFVKSTAPDWPMADQTAFAADCAKTLASAGCDRTVKGVRIHAAKTDPQRFRIETWRP
jgi:hypothetical protein